MIIKPFLKVFQIKFEATNNCKLIHKLKYSNVATREGFLPNLSPRVRFNQLKFVFVVLLPLSMFGYSRVNFSVIEMRTSLDHVEICVPNEGVSLKQRRPVSDDAYWETHSQYLGKAMADFKAK